jgi:hypothetical protein
MRIVNSMSSPNVSLESPPTARRRSRRKTPNAPEMISSPLSAAQPIRAPKNERMYSATCEAGVPPSGTRGSTTVPCWTTDPFAILTVPPTATTRSGSALKISTIRASASGSSSESTSVVATRSCRARLIPTFNASARRPFCLYATRRRGSERET